jgi:K+-transporting ATPase ATPase A chain
MSADALIQVGIYFAVLIALVKPLGAYMARVYSGEKVILERLMGPVERLCYRAAGVDRGSESGWKEYAWSFIVFNIAGFVVVYMLQRLQGVLPLNPQHLSAVPPDLSFNTAVSFMTNTNWQSYSGEATLSYLTQMLGLTVQNFVSAASGMAVLIALAKGFSRKSASTVGNFWVDLVRGTLYILLPLAIVLAIVLVSQGVVQTFGRYPVIDLVQPLKNADGSVVSRQVIAVGPAASQVAIKQLGTNGGGFFGANSAHPFENPNPFTNFLEMLAILLIPAALCYTFGRMVRDTRQGWALLAAMLAIVIPLTLAAVHFEESGNPAFAKAVSDHAGAATDRPQNMEGKEVRFGAVNSALWASITTAASNGSVNSMHDSFTPLGGLIPMWLMQLGEIVFGGVGSGLYGMIIFAIVAVFVAGLMVGRTPEYMGKKIGAYEMKMASLVILVPAMLVLCGTAIALVVASGKGAVGNPGPHGFSEVLYAFSSASNNNGSAFAGLAANNLFYNVALGVAMFLGRFWVAVPVLAIAGSLAGKKTIPPGPGTLPTHTPLFVGMLIGVIIIVGALTFFPVLALGPVVEHLMVRG